MRKKWIVSVALALLAVLLCGTALAGEIYCTSCYQVMKKTATLTGPFCKKKGTAEYTCPNGHKLKVETPIAGHQWDRIKAEFPTCTKEGWQDVVCLRCGAQERQVLPMKSHYYESPWTYCENGSHRSACRYGCGTIHTERCSMWVYDIDGEGPCSGICLVCGHTEQWEYVAAAMRAYPTARFMDADDVYAELTGAQKGFTKTRSCEGYLKLEADTLRDRFNLYVGSGSAKNVLACVVHALPEGVTLAADGDAARVEPAMEGGRGSTVAGDGVGAVVKLDNGTQAALLISEIAGRPESLPSGLYATLPVSAAGAGENTVVLNLDLTKARKLSDIEAVLVVFSDNGWNEKK